MELQGKAELVWLRDKGRPWGAWETQPADTEKNVFDAGGLGLAQ